MAAVAAQVPVTRITETETMTETTPAPLTISVHDYALREAEKEVDSCGLTDPSAIQSRSRRASARVRDQVGKQIMSGTLRAYTFVNGKQEAVHFDATPRHYLIVQLAAWLDGKRSEPLGRGFLRALNNEWIDRLHIEDVDIAAELAAARAKIVELEARLADLETGGITVEGREASELEAAISIYRAVAKDWPEGEKLNSKGQTPVQALEEKAQEFCKGLDRAAPARIATVCNWDKSRGRKGK